MKKVIAPQQTLKNETISVSLPVRLLFVSLLVFMPHFFSNGVMDVSLFPQWIWWNFSVLVFLILFMVSQKIKTWDIPKGPFLICLSVYVTAQVLSLHDAVNVGEGLREIYKTISFLVTFLIFYNTLKTGHQVQRFFLKCILYSSALLCLVGFVQFFDIIPLNIPGNVVPYGSLGNRNVFVPAMSMLIPFVILHSLMADKKSQRYYSLALGLSMMVLMILSEMRSAWMAFILSAIAVCILYFISKQQNGWRLIRQNQRLRPVLLTLPILGIAALIYGFQQSPEQLHRLLNLNSVNERAVLWTNSFRMMRDEPLLGAGVGNWTFKMPEYGMRHLPQEARWGSMIYSRPENDFLWVASETGIPSGIAYLLLFLLPLVHVIRILPGIEDRQERMALIFSSGAWLMYFIISMVNFPKERPFLLVEMAAIPAFILSITQKYRAGNLHFRLPVIIPFIIICLLCIYTLRSFAGEKNFMVMFGHHQYDRDGLALKFGKKAIEKGYETDASKTPVSYYTGNSLYRLGNTEEAILAYRRALELAPNHLSAINSLAACYSGIRDYIAAEKLLLRALRISDDFPAARLNLSALYLNTGRYGKALYYFNTTENEKSSSMYQALEKVFNKKHNRVVYSRIRKLLAENNPSAAYKLLSETRKAGKEQEYLDLKEKIQAAREKASSK